MEGLGGIDRAGWAIKGVLINKDSSTRPLQNDQTEGFCTSRSEGESLTRRTAGYAKQEVQSGTDRDIDLADRCRGIIVPSRSRQPPYFAFVIMHKENQMWIARTQCTRSVAILPVFVCIFLTSCVPIVAPPRVMPRVMQPTAGKMNAVPDPSMIRAGVTTRAEIIQQFGAFDTGWKGDRLFLGRWLSSRRIVIYGVLGGSDVGTTWVPHDLVVEFDEKSIVIRYQVLSDKRFLEELPRLLSTEKPVPDFQQAASGTAFRVDNVMGSEFLDLSAFDGRAYWKSRITRGQIDRYRLSIIPNQLAVLELGLNIHLRGKVDQEFGGGEKRRTNTLSFRDDVPNIVLLVQFLHLPSAKP
jgi:hypothetical protein